MEHADAQKGHELHALREKFEVLEQSLQQALTDVKHVNAHLQEEMLAHQYTREELHRSDTRFHEELTSHHHTREEVSRSTSRLRDALKDQHYIQDRIEQLALLLQQEIRQHEDTKAHARLNDTLVKDTYHRVKNHLSMVIAFLSLQREQVQSAETHAIFNELETRIRTLVLLYDHLCRSTEGTSINLPTFITAISTALMNVYTLRPGQVTVTCDMEEVEIPFNQVLPCGLIVNELLTNSLKYAFPDGRTGRISICGQRQPPTYLLTVHDDGVGLPETFDHTTSQTLGMQLVAALTQQLKGTFRIEQQQGTRCQLQF